VKNLIDKDALIEWLQQSKVNYLNHRTELIGTDFIAGAKSIFKWLETDLKNVLIENSPEKIDYDNLIGWLEERREINRKGREACNDDSWQNGYYSGCKEAFVEIINRIKAGNPKENPPDIPDKRCGTCEYFQAEWAIQRKRGCFLRWIKQRGDNRPVSMECEDGYDRPDWKEKLKEKRRVWTCLNCSRDIYFAFPTFLHTGTEKFQCSNRIVDYYNVAIPHPDKPMREE
jgi:hypothetical protein